MSRHTAFQHVNDAIRALAPVGPATQTWEFFCECDDIACRAIVPLTLVEFDALRAASPRAPIVAAPELTAAEAAQGARGVR